MLPTLLNIASAVLVATNLGLAIKLALLVRQARNTEHTPTLFKLLRELCDICSDLNQRLTKLENKNDGEDWKNS